MVWRRRAGSSAPTSSAPLSASLSVCGSGPLMQRMMPAPLSTSGRLPIFAPAASKSASEIEASSPAAFSTATSAPSATNFFTVSGIAAQRVSPGASFKTAIFIRQFLPVSLDDHHPQQPDNQAPERSPFQQSREVAVVGDVVSNVLSRRADDQGFFFGHQCSLRTSVGRFHNKGLQTPQVLTLACTAP